MNKIDNILKDYLKYKGGNIQSSREEKINKLINKITGEGEIKKIVGIKVIEDTDNNSNLINEQQLKDHLNNIHMTDKKTNPVINQFFSSSEKEF